MEVREGPQLRSAWPARSPAAGGGVLWISGRHLAAAAGDWPGCVVAPAADGDASMPTKVGGGVVQS